MSIKDENKYKRNESIDNTYIQILNSASSENNSEIEIVLRYLGYEHRVKSDKLKEQFKEIRSELGISFRTVELSGEWYKDNMLPLLVKHNGEYKAVLPNYKGSCVFFDGKRRKTINE